MSGLGHVILTQQAMLVHSYSIFVCKKKHGRLLKRDTILEFMGEMSEASKDDIDVLFETLMLDLETTPPAPAPPTTAIGEPYPSFAHATLQNLECQQRTKQLLMQ